MSAWIFLRGLTRESRHWGEFPEVFHRQMPDAAMVMADLPGNGIWHAQPSPTGVAAMAEHCRADLAARGVRPPYVLLAMSLGAMVAVDWMQRHPDEIAGAVLINTSLRPFSAFHERLRPRSYAALLRLAARGDAEAREVDIFELTSRRSEDRAAIVRAWAGWRREHPVSAANALRQLFAALRYRPLPARPAAPLLVLASAGDDLVNPRCSAELARRWHADFALHPWAGHDLPLDDAAWVAREVGRWFAALPRYSAAAVR